jgi:hypothetical protein
MSYLLSCTTKQDEPRVSYVCCSASRELRGLMEWSIPRISSSRLVMSCEVATFIIRVHSTCQICKASVTPDFPKKTKCISYVRQDQVYTHMIDVMSEISININKNVQELNHYIIFLLHSDVRLEGLYNDQTITMKTQLHLHLPQAHDRGHASLRTPRSRWSTLLQCSPLNSG